MTGWRAECSDCQAVIEPDYGARVFPNAEFEDTDCGRWAAERWAIEHRTANAGHNPTVNQFTRWTMTIVEPINAELLALIFGRPAEPFLTPLDELRDAVYWARNVAFSELGIETADVGPRALPAGRG